MTTAAGDADGGREDEAEASTPNAETQTRLQQAASGVAGAQAWKGQQIAKGWRRFADALRSRKKEGE